VATRQAATKEKRVYLMRGVPGAGKSYTAKKLAGRKGFVCETDSFFGPSGKDYNFVLSQRPMARANNMIKFLHALIQGTTPIVVDRGNGRGERTRWYIATALLFGYTTKFAEPTSKQWSDVKELFDGPWINRAYLWLAAGELAKIQKKTHRVSRSVIFKSLLRYDPNLTVEEVMDG